MYHFQAESGRLYEYDLSAQFVTQFKDEMRCNSALSNGFLMSVERQLVFSLLLHVNIWVIS
jgi:hypothetical protein